MGFERRGFTLVELLVVITIIFMLTAAAIPLMRPALEGRESRDTARAVSTFISGARTRAMELGRPVGVMIERDAAQPHVGIRLSYAVVPEPYTGDTPGSTIVVRTGFVIHDDTALPPLQAFPRSDVGYLKMVRPGDTLRLNYQGRSFRLTGSVDTQGFLEQPIDASKKWILVSDSPMPTAFPFNQPLPFQIYRQPVKSSERVLVLPTRTMIDLMSSGIGAYPQRGDAFFAPLNWDSGDADYGKAIDLNAKIGAGAAEKPVLIMFAPNGSVSNVYQPYANTAGTVWQWGQLTPTDMIYLAIGPRIQAPTSADMSNAAWPTFFRESDGVMTWEDLGNMWITINPVTGMIQTAENAAVKWPSGMPTEAWPLVRDGVTQARAFAREAQAIGGR